MYNLLAKYLVSFLYKYCAYLLKYCKYGSILHSGYNNGLAWYVRHNSSGRAGVITNVNKSASHCCLVC